VASAGGSYLIGGLVYGFSPAEEEDGFKNILSGFNIRDAMREDNEKLLNFSKGLPWGTRWTVTAEHGPYWAQHIVRLEHGPCRAVPRTKSFIKIAEGKGGDENQPLVGICTGALMVVKDTAGGVRLLGHILELEVHENQRRRGIGNALLHSMERQLVKAGAEVVQSHFLFNQQGDSWHLFLGSNKYKPCSATRIYGWPTTSFPRQRMSFEKTCGLAKLISNSEAP